MAAVGPAKEQDGSWSMRRILAAVFAFFEAVALAGVIWKLDQIKSGWIVLAILGVPAMGVILLLFFTTWGDITEVINAAVGIQKPGSSPTQGITG